MLSTFESTYIFLLFSKQSKINENEVYGEKKKGKNTKLGGTIFQCQKLEK